MKIGILQCDDVVQSLQERHGNYPDMFIRLLRKVEPDLSFQTWRCHDGQIPEADTDVDAWLITGSRHGINDDLPWIEPLCVLLRQLYALKKPVIGVCFGHQLIAHAMQGSVVRNPGGWGVGISSNQLTTRQPWMEPWQPTLDLIVSHQDQVVSLPDDGQILASSPFCPYYFIQLGSTFLGIQGHPEFTKAYAADLMEYRRGIMPDALIEAGLATLSNSPDAKMMAQWMLNFMRLSVPA